MNRIKGYFFTGLVLLLPLALTIIVVSFLFNLITDPFVGIFRDIFHSFHLFESGVGFLSAEQVQIYAGKIIAALVLFFFTLILGGVAQWFFFHSLLKFWDYILHRIPFVSSIYKTFQDVINTFFSGDTNSFKQVVLVPFPTKDSYAIGFLTQENFAFGKPEPSENEKLCAIFVPTAPNPTSGFLIAFQETDLIYVSMTVEEAFKCILSCGAIIPPFKAITKDGDTKEGLINYKPPEPA